ncbi:MAG: glycosyltransferase family 2 protein [Ignavibacteriaceae bacterium]
MITVICPTYNEENYIGKVLEFFVNSMPKEKEFIIIDGGSEDNTREIVKKWSERNENIHLLENPEKYVPFALNIGIRSSNGDPIIRLDAHTEYAPNYFEKIIETFSSSGADIVGGGMNAVGKSNFQKAVAFATSTQFGVGDSKIHQESYRGDSDHVYLGAWRRKLFDDIGYFDEKLKRNQDDEFHYRARSLGKRIYLNPDIKSYYYPRDSVSKLSKQYFQYGLFKPLVIKKIRSEAKIRHLVPSLFTIYIFFTPLIFLSNYYLVPLIVYLLLDLYFSLKSKLNAKIVIFSIFIYPTIHLSYGFGFLFGLLKSKAQKL